MKRIILLLTIGVLFTNCGGSGNTKEPTREAVLKDVEQILDNITAYSNFVDGLKEANNQYKNRSNKIEHKACNSGFIDISYDPKDISVGAEDMDIITSNKYVGCIINNVKFDGDVKYRYTNTTSYMECLSDYVMRDSKSKVSIIKGSSIKIESGLEADKTIVNISATNNGVTFGGENLIFYSNDTTNPSWIYPASGKEMVGYGVVFRVDSNYDASKTPFTSDENDNLLKGGLFQYLDNKDRKAQIEVTDINEITIRLDINANGIFEKDEERVLE